MSTTFSSLPIIDLSALNTANNVPVKPSHATKLSHQLYDVFSTTGFAYLINTPLTFSHQDIFNINKEFFGLSNEEKTRIAKKTFNPSNSNTYRGYFPTQPLIASDNLKEGFEQGPSKPVPPSRSSEKINLAEFNVWPDTKLFNSQNQLEKLYDELQNLSAQLLSLLAMGLERPADYFDHYLTNSISTLRLLHYPATETSAANRSTSTLGSNTESISSDISDSVKLSCTPHTDSGILTLLHQDSTGGLEVRNAAGQWIPAPYIPGSIVVNIGDLMAEVSGGRFVATMHRVRTPKPKSDGSGHGDGFGRFSVPFFFEPGEDCIVKSVDREDGPGIVYGEHVRSKMKTWVEFQDDEDDADGGLE